MKHNIVNKITDKNEGMQELRYAIDRGLAHGSIVAHIASENSLKHTDAGQGLIDASH